MKHISFAWAAFVILLLTQIIFYAITFPRLLHTTEASPHAFPGLLFGDLTGITAWVTAWMLDHKPTPRTGPDTVRIVILIFWALLIFRIQFHAW